MLNSQLAGFVCIADSGSFNKTAEKLFVSSTAVIKQMNALENIWICSSLTGQITESG